MTSLILALAGLSVTTSWRSSQRVFFSATTLLQDLYVLFVSQGVQYQKSTDRQQKEERLNTYTYSFPWSFALKVAVNSSHGNSDKHILTQSYVTSEWLLNVCYTSFERVKTAVLHVVDVLDCVSVPMEIIRLVFEPLSLGIRASTSRTDREPGSRSSSLLDHRQRYCAEMHRFL